MTPATFKYTQLHQKETNADRLCARQREIEIPEADGEAGEEKEEAIGSAFSGSLLNFGAFSIWFNPFTFCFFFPGDFFFAIDVDS